MDDGLKIGNPDEWPGFVERNRLFVGRSERLEQTLKGLFLRPLTPPNDPMDRYVYYTARLSVDDFFEIMTVCGNSEAAAAQKLLRTMFERVVTLLYLMDQPDKLDVFFKFFWKTRRRLLNQIEGTFQSGLVDPDEMRKVNEEFQRIRADLPTRECEKCGHETESFTWTAVDTVQMARKVGLSDYIVPAWYLPMPHIHPSVEGILNRLTDTPDGAVMIKPRLDPIMSDRVLCAAHGLLLFAMQAQVLRFKLDRAAYEQAQQDYREIWMDGRPDLKAPGPPAVNPKA
jgi:hypothetical protein